MRYHSLQLSYFLYVIPDTHAQLKTNCIDIEHYIIKVSIIAIEWHVYNNHIQQN